MVPDLALELVVNERGLLSPEELVRLRAAREEAARRGAGIALFSQLIERGVPAAEVPALQAEAAARARPCQTCRRWVLCPRGAPNGPCPGCGGALGPGGSGRFGAVNAGGVAQSLPGSSARLPAMHLILGAQGANALPATGPLGGVPGSAPGSSARLAAVVPGPHGSGPATARQVIPSTGAGEAPPGEDSSWGVGRRIGRYELLEELGRGAMGAVYLVQPLDAPGRELALKLLLGGDMASASRRKRFEDEVRLLMRLDHPHLIKVLDWGLADGAHPYYVMEFVPGRDLRDLIKEGTLSVPEAARMVMQLARAVHHAHSHGVLHRDLKPDNVRVSEDLSPVLIDFGLAKDMEQESGLTRSGVALGTPHYMSPEQAEGRLRDVDSRTDVWALGVILYELLGRQVPFSAKSMNELARKIARDEPESLRGLRPEVSRALEAACLRALRKKPDDRWPSAAAFADGLQQALVGGSPGPGRSHAVAIAGLILCAGVATAIVLGLRPRADSEGPDSSLAPVPKVANVELPGLPAQELATRLSEVRTLLDRARAAEALSLHRDLLGQAESKLSELIGKADPPEARLLRAGCRRDLDRCQEARADLRPHAIDDQSIRGRAFLVLGLLELRYGEDPADALKAFRSAGDSAPTNSPEQAATRVAAAMALAMSGDLQAARQGVEAVLAERPDPEVVADALCALAWVLRAQVRGGGDAASALEALVRCERLFRVPRFRYEYALDKACLLAAAGQDQLAVQAKAELESLVRDAHAAELVDVIRLRAQGRPQEALTILQGISGEARPKGVQDEELEALASALAEQARRPTPPAERPPAPPKPSPPLPGAGTGSAQAQSPTNSQSLVVCLSISPGEPSLNMELNIPAAVDGVWLALRAPEGSDVDLFGAWDHEPHGRQDAQLGSDAWSPSEDVILRRGARGPRQLRGEKLKLCVLRTGNQCEAQLVTLLAHIIPRGTPEPVLWRDGDLFEKVSDMEQGRKIEAASEAWARGEVDSALQGLAELVQLQPRYALFRASLLGQLDRWEEAAQSLENLEDPRALVWRARCARKQGHPEDGVRGLERLIQASPDLLQPRLELAECLLAAKRAADALTALRSLRERDPWETRAEVLEALAQIQLGAPDGIALLAAAASRTDSTIAGVERALDELLQRGEAQRAFTILNGVTKSYKNLSPTLLALQVECLARVGQEAESARVRTTLQALPQLPGTRRRVGAILARIPE